MKPRRTRTRSEAKVQPKSQVDRAPETRIVNGLVVFDIPTNAAPITSEQVKKLESGEL